MKCVLLLSLAALSCAVPLTPDGPGIRIEKNYFISLTGHDGQKLLITKSIKNDGSNYVEISVTDLQGRTNTFRVDQENNLRLVKVQEPGIGDLNVIDQSKKLETSGEDSKKERTESDILKEIFQEFQSAVGLKAYEDVLRKIDSYIKSGDLHSSIFEVLKSFAKYESLRPEGSYYYSRQTYFPYYVNRASDEEQREKFGVRQPASDLSEGTIYFDGNPLLFRGVPLASQRIVQWPQYGMNEESLQQYRDLYGQIEKQQVAPVQAFQQYPQQAWQPLSKPYQRVAQTLQQWNLPQSFWNLPRQQLVQEQQKLPQQLAVPQYLPQKQQLQQQGVFTQPREQLSFLGQDRVLPNSQSSQDLPWNPVQQQQQYYGPQQQYYVPQQQLIGSQLQNKVVQQQYFRPQQPYADFITVGEQLPQTQQGYLWTQNPEQALSVPQPWIRSQTSQPQLNFVY